MKKIFLKLMNNSVYGKTMEKLRKRIKVRLVNNATKDYKKYVEPSFVSQKIFSKTFVAVHEIKPVLTLILDLSKLLMYDFHYKYIKVKYYGRSNLLLIDSDSLVYEIETDDVYEDFYEDKNLSKFSDYPEDSKFLNPVNKKVVGKMKDEARGKIIIGFVGLKSKMYSLVMEDNEKI